MQVVLPLSGMGSWAAVVIGALMSLHVLGINLAPLLTVGMGLLDHAFSLSLWPWQMYVPGLAHGMLWTVKTLQATKLAQQRPGCELSCCLPAGGISGIVVGLSAQAVLGNMVSGLNLYISRPFVAGSFHSSVSHHCILAISIVRCAPVDRRPVLY